MLNLSIIIPVFNEIKYLDIFTSRLTKSFKNQSVEYIFVNDGSSDGSGEWLNNFCKKNLTLSCKLIELKKNFGKGKALIEGIKHSNGEYVLFQDADLELDTNDSLEMLNIINKDLNIKCLFGTRYLTGKLKKKSNVLNEFVVKFNSLLFNILFGQSLSDLHCGTKIISKEVLNSINLTINDFGFEIDIASQIAKKNYEIYEYGISYFARTKQEGKKITWIDGLKSYYYLFKTRFLQNEISTIISIFFSGAYMTHLGSYIGMGLTKSLTIGFFLIIGLFIGLHKKIISSSLVLLSCYLSYILSPLNLKIYSLIFGLFLGLYISRKISNFVKSKISNKYINYIF